MPNEGQYEGKAMNGFPLAFAITVTYTVRVTTVAFPFLVFFMVRLYDQDQFNQILNVYNLRFSTN